MSENLQLIGKKLEHLARMRGYLDYSTRKMQGPLEKIRGKGLDALSPEEHETIAAFRTRVAVDACKCRYWYRAKSRFNFRTNLRLRLIPRKHKTRLER